MEKSIAKFPVNYWDGLKTKEELYEGIDSMDPADRNLILAGEPAYMKGYYKDNEFKEVGEKLENVVKALRPLLKDIEKRFAAGDYEERVKQTLNSFNLNSNAELGLMALLICNALEAGNVYGESFINRIKNGNGIPEERAAIRAGERYNAFKKQDAEKLEAFKQTPEYALQEAELKFKRRDKIELPEE